MHFIVGSLPALAAALFAGLSAGAVIFIRRRRLGLPATIFFSAAISLLIPAAGDLSVLTRSNRQVTVMVDMSASTRGAAYRDPSILNHRIAELLANTPYNLVPFSDPAAERTIFSPVPADAILLFSDGRFAPPDHAAPVFPVLDPMLENTTDASITQMQFIGDQLAVSVANNGPPRLLTLHGITGPTTQMIQGSQTILRPLAPAAGKIWAELSPGDLWPENDFASIPPPPPLPTERWWIGPDAPNGWRAMSADELPVDPNAYFSPSVIALNNIAADELPAPAQYAIDQYVRDLGGSLLILGGPHAFAAGGYQGTILESLSPLSCSPPSPRTLWILLADASGSMSQPLPDGQTRWDKVSRAIVDLLPHLPSADPVRVGQFSDTLKWWSDGRPAAQTALLPLPPSDAAAHGPTNLQPALEAIAASVSAMPTQLLVLTDADVELTDPAALTRRLIAANVRLHLLAIGRGSGIAELEDIVHDTGGSFITQLDSGQWSASIRRLLTAANPRTISDQPASVTFTGPLVSLPTAAVFPWNPVWIKPAAAPLAAFNGQTFAASWRLGVGQVLAAAFSPTASQTAAFADLIAQPPRDPRLKVSWQFDPAIHVTIDAFDGNNYLNNLDLSIEIWDQISAVRQSIPQTAPGRYELSFPAGGRPAIATVRQSDRILDRTALFGGYAPEFSAIGQDQPALEKLAVSTGGKLIPPTQTTPIDFNWPLIPHRLMPWLSATSAILLAAGLIAWKRSVPAAASA